MLIQTRLRKIIYLGLLYNFLDFIRLNIACLGVFIFQNLVKFMPNPKILHPLLNPVPYNVRCKYKSMFNNFKQNAKITQRLVKFIHTCKKFYFFIVSSVINRIIGL